MTFDAAHSNPTIAARLSAIYTLHRKANDFRLTHSPYNDLLTALGNPHLNLPPTIHIAGTNGKGSTLAFLKSLYEAAGYTVHAYTSPHLLNFNERITLAGEHISDDMLLHYLNEMDVANDGRAVTFFEYTTALAFKAMAETPADICLLETGLGGRLDCTNIIKDPMATVITSIGYDHIEFLGPDIKGIAAEKAGIIKGNAPCIVARQIYPEIMDVFRQKTENLHLVEIRQDLPPLGLVGAHQAQNASTALAVIDVLADRFPVSQTACAQGLADVKWRGRMEKITHGALYDALPIGTDLWFDCGHNAEGAQTIGAELKTWKEKFPDRPIHLMMGIAGDKNPNDFLAPLWESIDALTCIDLPNARNPQSAAQLRAKITHNSPINTAANLKAAMTTITDKNAIILIAGSVYLYRDIW